MSKLVEGMIPKGQECPFVEQCRLHNNGCRHLGKEHKCDFSCAAARGFDMSAEFVLAKNNWKK